MPIYLPTSENIARAAQLLRNGELVALPTETVYGLGANALDTKSVQKIFALKGRPSFNPLIVHVLDENAARELVTVWPTRAQILAKAFWPGALTLILPKREIVPDIVTAGLQSVALRAPSHAVARQLLHAAQLPLAAPSANKYTQTSPTRAEHVASSLGDELFVLDGGACEVGIESTVLDLTGDVPILLRPGMISHADIEAALGEHLEIEYSIDDGEEARRAPGQVRKHYAPRAKLLIFQTADELQKLMHENSGDGVYDGALLLSCYETCHQQIMYGVEMPDDPTAYARRFYETLHALDELCTVIFVEDVPQTSEWDGVRDRLYRASSQ